MIYVFYLQIICLAAALLFWGVEKPKPRNILLLASVLCAVVIFFAACGPPPPDQGYVRSKRHVPEDYHWHDTSHWQCVSYDSKGICNTNIYIDSGHEHFHPERWELQLEECKERKGPNCIKGWLNLGSGRAAQDTWDRYGINDHYPDPR